MKVIRRSKELRPITLMQRAAKLFVAVSNEELADIVQRASFPQQRGFVPGRVMSDSIIEVEGGLNQSSASCSTHCLRLFFWLSLRRFLLWRTLGFLVLRHLGVCGELSHIIEGLYMDMTTVVFYNAPELNHIPITSGITQGCPMFGSIFAIGDDRLIRAHLAALTLQRFRLDLFDGDVDAVLKDIQLHLSVTLDMFGKCCSASGLM